MERKMVIIWSFIAIGAIVILLLGCPPPVVRVRPPEPRVEVYSDPPHPDAVWRSGHWTYKRGEWIWIPGHWAKRPKPHAHWIPGHWEPRGGGWIWIDGHWEYR